MLKPAQVWTVITVLFAILGGSFGLGYKLRGLTSEAAPPSQTTGNGWTFRTKSGNSAIQVKEKFLALYLRYMIAQDAVTSKPFEENEKVKKEAGEYLRDFIEELLKRGEEAKDEIDLSGLSWQEWWEGSNSEVWLRRYGPASAD